MSLTDSPDWLFRPEDKALKMLFPTVDEPIHNSFDEFFDNDFYNSGNVDLDKDSPPSNDFSVTDYSHNIGTSKQPELFDEVATQPWRKGLWCLNTKPTSDLLVAKTRKINTLAQKFIAPGHLTAHDDVMPEDPSVSLRAKTKAMLTRSNPVTRGKDDVPRNAVRQQTLSPSRKHAQLSSHENMAHGEQWQQDFQNFHLQMPDHGIYLSSPHSRKLVNVELTPQQTNARVIARNATVAHAPQSPTKYHYPFNHMSRPTNDFHDVDQIGLQIPEASGHMSSIKNEATQHQTQQTLREEYHTAPAWTTESLHSSDSSSQSYNSHVSNGSHSQMWSGPSARAWPGGPVITTTFSPHGHALQLAAPLPQRLPHQILYQQEHYIDGCGIQYPDTDGIGRAVPYESVDMNLVEQGNTHDVKHRMVTPPPLNQGGAYPPLPPYPAESISDISPFTTPRRRHTPHSRSPSPSISPSHRATRRSIGQRSPTKDYTHTRRKSIHKTGPIKDTSSQEIHRRARSTSRPPRTPRTPKTPTGAGFPQAGFVNFTPKDSAKLMNDVAPSGSSKTRARRDQEARDKRKKLNEAALQAVRNAGGDVTALERAIFV